MIVDGVNLKDFSEEKPFGFIDICSNTLAGIYVVIQRKEFNSEIVKIGESESIYSRFANYLSPFRTNKEKNSSNRKTKREFRNVMQEGIKNGYKYSYVSKEIKEKTKRKDFEKSLIEKYLSTNRKKPKMNNEKWINKYLNDLDIKKYNQRNANST
jgi:hypothetical protein